MKAQVDLPTIAEGSVDPSPGVRAAIEERLLGELGKLRRAAVQAIAQPGSTLRTLLRGTTCDLYDAMIAWMGPAGDPAFLDFYLLAEGRLPPLEFALRYRTERDDRQPMLAIHVADLDRSMVRRSAMRTLYTGMTGRFLDIENGAGAKVTKATERATCATVAREGTGSIWQAVVLPPITVRLRDLAYKRTEGAVVTLTVAPWPSYRSDLLGELAAPWPAASRVPDAFEVPRYLRRPEKRS